MTALSERSPRRSAAVSNGAIFLAIIGFLLIAMRQNFTVPGTRGHSVAQTLIIVAAVFWVLARLRGRRSQIRSRPLKIAVLLYTIASLASYYLATSRGPSEVAQQGAEAFVTANILLAAMVFTIIATLTTTSEVMLVLKGTILGGTVSAVFAIVQSTTGMDLATEFRFPGLNLSVPLLKENIIREEAIRAQGSASHPLELASVLTMLIPLGVGIIGCARARGEKTWPWTACTLVILCAALLSVSRSAIIGLFVAGVVMAWRWPIRRTAAIFVCASFALIIAWSLGLPIVKALGVLFANTPGDPSVQSRQAAAAYAFAHYDEYFWLGEGAGTYLSFRGHPNLDNEYLIRLMDTGVFGLTTYVVLLCVALILALRASTTAANDIASLASGVSGSIAALMAAGLIFDFSGFEQAWFLVWFVMALGGVVFHISRHGDVISGEFQPTSLGSSGRNTGRYMSQMRQHKAVSSMPRSSH